MRQSWWVVLFLACGSVFYFHGMWKKDVAHQELQTKLKGLEREKQEAAEKKQELTLQIQSQDDPAFVEMTLMKGLGLVPEGQVKVYFTPQ